ncbi:serine acetyltransferase [Sphingomonas sp. Leaf242]|uniref:serine acetyltransferase n=1 Tax=Sphingomonas sp. Leaf242 TaxID=1736304 RepID=UPI0007129DE3|nr:serine acetyltransferase [Sphingomonas sp. Leaf242]KQO08269.1 hypothetical protein ASF09_10260 [Sphingomonas sp. Leaf242]
MTNTESGEAAGFRAAVRRDLALFAHHESTIVTAGFALRMILVTQGFQFVLARRIQDLLAQIPVIGRPMRRIWWWGTCRSFGSEIAIGCTVSPGLYIPHPYGIVVGVCTLGENVAILQNVTIGSRHSHSPGHARIGRNAYLSAGAAIIGAISIGEGAMIGANAVVLRDVPNGAVAVGVPARIVVAS